MVAPRNPALVLIGESQHWVSQVMKHMYSMYSKGTPGVQLVVSVDPGGLVLPVLCWRA